MRSISPTWSATRCSSCWLSLVISSVRPAEFAEQPRVLDGDDGLGGEVLHQFDLFVCEGTNLLAIDGESADQLIFLQHWDS